MLCLTALCINEKLMLANVFLLPFVQMFQTIFGKGQENEQMVETWRHTNGSSESNRIPTSEKNWWLQNVDEHLTNLMTKVCKNNTEMWYKECWYHVRDQCRNWSTKANPLLWLHSMFYCNTAAFAVCSDSKRASERLLEDNCKSDRSALGSAYKKLGDVLTKLGKAIVIDPKQIKVNSEVMEMTAGFDRFTKYKRMDLVVEDHHQLGRSCIGTSSTVNCHD